MRTLIRQVRTGLRCLAQLLVVLAFSAAYAQEERDINIPPQALETALRQLAAEQNLQILFAPGDVKNVMTRGVKGRYSAQEAAQRLLEGTGLTATSNRRNFVTIKPAQAKTERDVPTEKGAIAGAIVLAQASGEPSGQVRADQLETPKPGRSATAQAGDSVYKAESIRVTAQKRDERAFDVPISIVAMDANELEKRKISRLDDLTLVVPGLSSVSNGYTRQITLRGLGNTTGSSSLIGLYLDEAPVTSAPNIQLDLRTYDLERVEVLRGPQGTLYGEGSVGGTIRFITKDPQLTKFGLNADVATLFTKNGVPSQRIDSAVNVPLIEGELGLRIAGTFEHLGGWIDQPAANRKDFNEQNATNVRAKALWRPAPQLSVSAMSVVHRHEGSLNSGETEGGNYNQVFNLTTSPAVTSKYDLHNVTLAYDFPAFRVLSTTSYIDQMSEQRNVGNRSPLIAPPPAVFEVYVLSSRRDAHIGTQELRLTSGDAGALKWTLGGFFRYFRLNLDIPAQYVGPPRAPGTGLPAAITTRSDLHSKSWAAFGDVSYDLGERLTLGAGLRRFEDDQDFNSGFGAATAFQSGTFRTSNPRVYALYRVSDVTNVYASAGKGFRSGGFNLVNQPSFGPETVWSYELGTKFSMPAARLNADVAIFYSDYKDYQITGNLPPPAPVPFAFTLNAGAARVKGVEWGVTWSPADRWQLAVNGHYLNTEFYELNVVNSAYAVGDPIDAVPKYRFGVSAQRDFEWNGKKGFARVDYNQQGRSEIRNRRVGPWFFSQSDVIQMLNLNLGLRWNEALSLSIFGQNLLNERGYVDPLVISEVASRPRPRTLGVGFSATF
jgi:iron complex outermembrane recepter protein